MAVEEHPDDAARRRIPTNDPVAPSSPEIAVPPSRNPEPEGEALGARPPEATSKGINMARLRESMDWSAKQLRPFRERYEECVKFYAGARYGGHNNIRRTPVNMLQLAVNIWTRQLVSSDPQVLALTSSPELRPDAVELEIAINHLLRQIKFGETLQRVVKQAMFGPGILKVGVTSPYLPSASGFSSQSGDVFADAVLFEDWLHDMNARSKEEWDWCANRYRVSFEEVMANPEFDPEVKQALKYNVVATSDDMDGAYGGGAGKKTSHLSTGDSIMRTEFKQHIELWDVWIPADNLIVTIPAQHTDKPLQVREWKGPENGPFYILSFSDVPGNMLPVAPAQTLFDLQDLITQLFNQLARQASRQKSLTIVDGRGENDGTGEAIRDASDGMIVSTNHIDSVKPFDLPGIDSSNFLFTKWVKELFSYMGGNIDAMGGLARQANTLGQEQLLAESSSEMLRDMQTKVIDFTKTMCTDLAWFMYTDPTMRVTLSKPVEGYGDIPFEYGPEQRTQDFFHYNFEIQPYSMQSQSPQDRLSKMLNIVQSVLLPLSPQLDAWGMPLDVKRLVEFIAKYTDMPEFNEIISSEVPMEGERTIFPAGHDTPGRRPLQSPSTQRHYIRENRTAGPPGGEDSELAKAMASLSQGGNQGGTDG